MKKPAVSQGIRIQNYDDNTDSFAFRRLKTFVRIYQTTHTSYCHQFFTNTNFCYPKELLGNFFCGSDEIELCGDDSRTICVVLRQLSFVIGMKDSVRFEMCLKER